MSPEAWVAILTAAGAFLLAVAAVIRELRGLRTQIDGRLEQMLTLTRNSAAARGNLEGRAELTRERDLDPKG